jgi:hypothetical protein
MKYLNEKGECGHPKLRLHACDKCLGKKNEQKSIECKEIRQIDIDRFHAEAIRETVEKMWELIMQEEGMTEEYGKQKEIFDAVLKCMEGKKI